MRKRRRVHHLERRGFALHEGLSQNPWSFQLGAWSLVDAWWAYPWSHSLSLLFRSFCMEEGASEEEGRTIFPSVAHQERSTCQIWVRSDALGDESMRASFCGERLSVSGSVYFLWSDLLRGGRMSWDDWQLPGSKSTWRFWALTVAVERQHRRGHSCGGVSSLGNRWAWAPQFSSEGNKGRGRTTVLGTSLSGSCCKTREELAMYTGSIVFHYLLYLLL